MYNFTRRVETTETEDGQLRRQVLDTLCASGPWLFLRRGKGAQQSVAKEGCAGDANNRKMGWAFVAFDWDRTKQIGEPTMVGGKI